jgi:hypothetical protein
MLDCEPVRTWVADKVSASFDEIVLDLNENGRFQQTYTVFADATIEPLPPTKCARSFLVEQAHLIRMQLR